MYKAEVHVCLSASNPHVLTNDFILAEMNIEVRHRRSIKHIIKTPYKVFFFLVYVRTYAIILSKPSLINTNFSELHKD